MGRRAIVLLVALILAGLAGWAVWNYLQGVEKDVQAGQVQVTVYRAVQAIDEGTDGATLFSDFNAGGDLLEESTEEQEDLPADAITSAEQLNQVLTGQVAAGPISANAILTESQWTTVTSEVKPLAEEIPSGKQAMTISVDNVRGVNGFVEPGDRINMIITLDLSANLLPADFSGISVQEPGTSTEGEQTTTSDQQQTVVVTYSRFVLQGIPVMATGRDIRPEADATPTVEVQQPSTEGGDQAATTEDTGNATIFTLEVTPEQAERIAYAFENGSIWLTLVPEDFVEVETTGVIIDTLFGGNLVEDIFGG